MVLPKWQMHDFSQNGYGQVGLERDGVVSEEPDAVHPAKMREDCVLRLLVVTLTDDDASRFLCATVPRAWRGDAA